jgi:hypothetical protein
LRVGLAEIAEQLGKTDFAVDQYKKAIAIEDGYRDQFRLMYPGREMFSRLGEQKYQFARQRTQQLAKPRFGHFKSQPGYLTRLTQASQIPTEKEAISLDKRFQTRYAYKDRFVVCRLDQTVHTRLSYRRTQQREKTEVTISLAGLTLFPRQIGCFVTGGCVCTVGQVLQTSL